MSGARLVEIARFELSQQLRRFTTPLFAVALVALTTLLNFGLAEGPRHVNSPLSVASASALMGLGAILVAAALFAEAATRDAAARTEAIYFTAPVRKLEHLGGRFAGALALNLLLVLAIPVGQLLALVLPPLEGPETYLPFRLATYVEPFLLLTLPNVLVTGVILFAVAALTRRALPTYVTALALCVAYLFAVELQTRTSGASLPAFVDPFGMIALRQHIRLWTPAERAVFPIGAPALIVWNRALWLGLTTGFFALLYWRFRMTPAAPARGRRARRAAVDAPPVARVDASHRIRVPAAARAFGGRTTLRQIFAIAGAALGDILRSRLFLGILAAGLALVVSFGWEAGEHVFETATWPVTHLIASISLTPPMSFVFALLVALYAGELVWRDRDLRMDAVAGATPVPEWATLAGNFLALAGLVVVLQAVLMGAGMLLQALQGYTRFEPLLYVRLLFGVGLANLLLLGVLAMAVHVIVDGKALGHLVVALIFASTVYAPALHLRHRLLIFGSDPGWVYSDMNGFGPFVAPFLWLKAYWGAWALLLAVVASLLWVRGAERGFVRRAHLARRRLVGPLAGALAAAAALVVGLGGFVFYNTNVLNEYSTPEEADARAAAYERRYARFAAAPQPQLVATTLRVEIHPERRAVEIAGHHTLVNRTGAPIDSLHVVLPRGVSTRTMTLDRPARLALDDGPLRYRIYALAQPLAPGDSLQLAFAVAHEPRGFPNSGISTAVAENGAYFSRAWLPFIGYQPSLELVREKPRAAQGLPPVAPNPDFRDAAARARRSATRNEDLVQVDAIIGTAGDQIAVTTGALVREWRAGGRRYFHYRTATPLASGAPFLSARYAVREGRWRDTSAGAARDVPLRIYHHPAHTFNLDRLMRAMQTSLDYYSASFGPYRFDELRIVEFPRYASFARAHPYTIAYAEGSSFLTRVEEWDVDRPTFVTAHETAHQWFGHVVSGAEVRGAAMLTETLAQYAAMMVLERTYGPEHARRFYDFAMKYYLESRGRALRGEVPLVDVSGQAWLYYHKGAVAMYTLREHIGEAAMNAALRRFLDRFRDAGPPYPTSRDLIAELRAATPDSLQGLVTDLFERVTLTEVAADSATAVRAPGGAYRVTLWLRASKSYVDTAGREAAAPMNDLVDVGVYAAAKGGEARGRALHLQQHRLRAGATSLTITVPAAPATAGVDPDLRLIQRMPRDNVVDVVDVVDVAGVPAASP